MFECTACTLRCIRAIAGDAINVQIVPKGRLARAPILANHPLKRHASTAIATKPPDDDFVPFEKPRLGNIIKKIPSAVIAEHRKPNAITKRDKPVSAKDEIVQTRPHAIKIEDKSALLKELEWLPDRLKLAQHVHYVLRCNDPEKALNLCRLASRKEEVIVSWNHVVDWHMKQGKVDDALKIYNEMKKRAQFPDAHTYTLILRGLATRQEGDWDVTPQNLVRAVTIYNSLSSPTSRVKPNIWHTNATLKVCAEAADMDALWGIVAKLPDSGSGAPDRVTYGIIINAIKKNAFGFAGHKQGTVDVLPRLQDKAMSEGRAVWKDIIARWRAGEVLLDEQLVLDMARLLLESSRMQDWDDVLNLFQQTMKIERLISPLGSPGRKVEHVPQLRSTAEDDAGEEDSDGWRDTPSGKAFLPVQPSSISSQHYRRTTTLAFVRPGPTALAVLINACMKLRIPKTAGEYWNLLTSEPFNVTPNHANFHIMLQLLRKNRASAKALALVRDGMPSAGLQPTPMTYLLAIVTCVRDMKNPNVLGYAREIIDMIQRDLDVEPGKVLGVESVVLYLILSLSTDSGPKILESLTHIHPMMKTLEQRVKAANQLTMERRPADVSGPEVTTRDKQMVVHLFRTNVGIQNAIYDVGLMPREESQHWRRRKAEYNQFISRMAALGVVDQPSGRPARGRYAGRRDEASGEDDEEHSVSKVEIGRTEPALQAFRRRQAAGVTILETKKMG